MAKMRQPLENPVMCGETWQHLFFYKEGIPEPKEFYDKPSRIHGRE